MSPQTASVIIDEIHAVARDKRARTWRSRSSAWPRCARSRVPHRRSRREQRPIETWRGCWWASAWARSARTTPAARSWTQATGRALYLESRCRGPELARFREPRSSGTRASRASPSWLRAPHHAGVQQQRRLAERARTSWARSSARQGGRAPRLALEGAPLEGRAAPARRRTASVLVATASLELGIDIVRRSRVPARSRRSIATFLQRVGRPVTRVTPPEGTPVPDQPRRAV